MATKYICTSCGKPQGQTEFYKSFSVVNKALGKMTICKTCVALLYADFVTETNNDYRLALYYLCRMLDLVYDERLYTAVQQQSNTKQGVNLSGIYIQKVNSLPQYKGKVFADSDMLEAKDNIHVEVTDEGIVVTDEMKARWGIGLRSEDYELLERQYKALLPRADINNPIQMMYVEDICKLKMEVEKARKSGKTKDYNDLLKVLSTLMNDAKLKPLQDETDAFKLAFGEWIAKIENEEPIPEPRDEFKDPDGIGKYITRWFTNQIGAMLGALKKEEFDDTEKGDKL